MEEYNTTLSFSEIKNVSRQTSPSPTPTTDCEVCDTQCIYSAVELIFIVGVLANALVLERVIRDKKLRKPTFVALAQLALFEGLFLLFNTAINVEDVLHSILCHRRAEEWHHVNAVLAVFWFCASFHVTLLAAMRYIMLAHPMRSLTLLTNKRIIIASVCLVIVSVLIFGTITLVVYLKGKTPAVEIITWFLTYCTPLLTTSVLHFVKISVVRRSLKFQKNASVNDVKRRNSSKRMIKIITIVIISGALLPLLRLVLRILEGVCDICIQNTAISDHLTGISMLLFLLNFSINPFIYSFQSDTFRDSLRRMTAGVTPFRASVISRTSTSQSNFTSDETMDNENDTAHPVTHLELKDDITNTATYTTHL